MSCRRVRTCHRGEVDLHPHLGGKTINFSLLYFSLTWRWNMAGAVEPLLYSSLNETGESTECCRSATERKAWIRSAFEEIENKKEWRAKSLIGNLDRGKRLALHHHCVALVLLCRHETSKPSRAKI